jgi:hypothetical protein
MQVLAWIDLERIFQSPKIDSAYEWAVTSFSPRLDRRRYREGLALE